MKCLPREQRETVVYKLLIFREGGSFQYFITTIGRIVKERMANMLKVCTNLIRTPCFQHTLHEHA